MAEGAHGVMPLREERDIVLCRQQVRALSQQLKFSLVDQTKMITAASELARNTVTYGGGGDMHWELVHDAAPGRLGVQRVEPAEPHPQLACLECGVGLVAAAGVALGLVAGGEQNVEDRLGGLRGVAKRADRDHHAAGSAGVHEDGVALGAHLQPRGQPRGQPIRQHLCQACGPCPLVHASSIWVFRAARSPVE